MSLPEDALLDMLQKDYVCGWKDIRKEDFCGVSHGYSKSQVAVGTTNGAGGRNVQIFVLTPDGRVLLALPGFWHPEDLRTELKFGKVLHRLWRDDSRSLEDKVRMWRRLHRHQPSTHSAVMRARSDWQGFDRSTELRRASSEYRDSIDRSSGAVRLLAIDQLVHRRLADRPFVPFEKFDIENFVDYGRRYYDLNEGFGKGRVFREVKRREAKRNRRG